MRTRGGHVSPGAPPGAGLSAALARLGSLRGVRVTVGIQSAQGAEVVDGGEALVQIAAKNEFGDDGPPPIPSRPWLRTTLERNSKRWSKLAGLVVKAAGSGGQTGEKEIRQLAVAMVGDAKETLLDGPWVPNAPMTIERKGSDQPLIDTGRLNQSQRAEVEIPGQGKYLVA